MLRRSFSASLAALCLSLGCSDPAAPAAAAQDAGTDTVVADTGRAADTRPADTGKGPLECKLELEADFACRAPTKITGETVCTDTMLDELAEKCLNSSVTVPAACNEWKTAYAACATCVGKWSYSSIPGMIYPDDWLCYWSVLDATCAKTVNCMYDCEYSLCDTCEGEDRRRCFSEVEKAGGECYDVAARDGVKCLDDNEMKLQGCNVDEVYKDSADLTLLKTQVVRYLRGACRDGGNWTNSASPTDGGVSDASPTDAGSGG